MVHGGVCVAHSDDGTTLLVEHAIPGELVDAVLRFRKGRTWFAAVATVREPSPHRVNPPCRYVPECGGCQLQHVVYDEQVALKRDVVLDALRRQKVPAPRDVVLHPATEQWSYRWRAEFHVVPGNEGVHDAGLGFNRSRSWRPISVDDCLIQHRAIRESLPDLRDAVRQGGGDALTALHVTVGDGGDELLVRGKPAAALARDAVDTVSLRMRSRRLATDATTEHWRGHTYRVAPDAFIQVHWAQMDVLYQCVSDALGEVHGTRIVDAYAGIGVLPVHLAARGAEVICIEVNRTAARAGMHNAQINGVANSIQYHAGAAEDVLPGLQGPLDAVVLDPPRAGCAGGVTGWLALAGPSRVVYVSCDPATFARDLHVLVSSGPYELQGLHIVDMFPQTYHVECVGVLLHSDR
ncbi:MAG: class I SAM-dependent RNA methyltransferase [Candidatus Dormibacteraeota bacterium]|nr:class I SAM-dependent RNA methyltransferase [Candidatus Dormibacteraeota bacterium]